jgi:hypothetical protein
MMKMYKKMDGDKKPKAKAVAVKVAVVKPKVKAVAVVSSKPLDKAKMAIPMMKKMMKKK